MIDEEQGRAMAESTLLLMQAGLPVPAAMKRAFEDYIFGCGWCSEYDTRSDTPHGERCLLGKALT